MTVYSVSQDSQALFPDGEQVAMSLINRGPWTIFIDSDSSIGDHSYQLKPTETLVWPANTPLWVKGNSVNIDALVSNAFRVHPSTEIPKVDGSYAASSLIATPITSAAASQDSATTLLPVQRAHMSARVGSGNLYYAFECSSYKSLVVTIDDSGFYSSTNGPVIDELYNIDFYWFDDSGEVVTVDRYNMFAQGHDDNGEVLIPQRIVMPVRARYCIMFFDSPLITQALGSVMRWRVEGSTVELDESCYHWMSQYLETHTDGSALYYRRQGFPVYVHTDMAPVDQVDYIHGSDFFYEPDFNSRIHLNNHKPRLGFRLRYVGVTTAFTMAIRSASDPSAALYSWTVPTGSGDITDSVFLPGTQPLYIDSTQVNGTARLVMSWSN